MLALGAILLASLSFSWWIRGSYERYIRIIIGPYPHDNLGGRPFHVMVYSGLFAAGFVLTSPALRPRSPFRNPV